MVIKTKNKDFFKSTEKDKYNAFECLYKDKIYGHVAVGIVNNHAVLHFSFTKFTHNTLKQALVDWDFIKKYCKDLGVKVITVTNFCKDDKIWEKFISYFGFPEPEIFILSKMEI